ncbi:MAG: TonB-dependent receptor [Bacteroidota bacterium]|nr:TonB-dependent receptor [Bacteroidota bacterium]
MRILKHSKPETSLFKLVFIFALLTFSIGQSQAKPLQDKVITGKVISSKDGKPLAGVTVEDSQNPKIGVLTDADGHYQIKLGNETKALRFSYSGFKPKLIIVEGKKVINVSLDENVSQLDEVVVVGYGKQKKVNQTGATETVRFDDAVNQPVTNTGQLMYGKFSGVQITQSSGLPGSDASSVVIRGVGTFGSTDPLVVIDNIQYVGLGAFNNLAPSDIESISVLKDASASAIYGARGANGVILVTTKSGKSGKMQVTYNGYSGIQQVTVVPQYLDAVNYARLRNEYDINTNGPTAPIRYSDADIQAIIDGSNPDQFANTKWSDVILRQAPVQNHYLSFSGGNEKTTYRLSVGYLNQQAVVKGKFKSERYNLSFNLNSKVNDWLTVSNVTNAYWDKFKGPAGGPNAITGETGIINQFQRSAPTIPAYYSNGKYGIVDGAYQNVNFSFGATNALMTGQLGDYQNDDINIADRLGVKVDFTKSLSFETSGSINLGFLNTSNFIPTYSTYDWAGNLVGQNLVNTLTNTANINYNLLNENILRYSRVFHNVHDFSILLGQSASYTKNDGFTGQLSGFPSNAVQEFDGGGVLNPKVSGGAFEVALQSFFGRLNYIYDNKYLFEFNIRRDGSSRFGPTHRYGTFPSASAGWRISQEKFLQNVNWLSELKLRGSWGITGNDNIGNYIYEQTYNSNLGYNLGNGVDVGAVALTSLANANITWETIKQFDIGLDAGLFANHISLTADYFKRNSSNILYTNFPIPSSIGVTNLAAQNAASMVNSGVELSVNYRGHIRKINFSIGGSVSKFADNKVTGLGDKGAPTINGSNIIEIGAPFRAFYGYKVIGIFQTQDEVNNAPKQFGSNKTAPGDFQYADISGPNGVPDGVVDAYDRTVIGNPYPKWTYNMVASASYQGFDLNVVFQGVQRIDRILNMNGEQPFAGDRNNSLSYWINRWTPKNPSTTLPRIGGQNNTIVSDFYIQDCSYLRLKNLEVGYTLPTLLTQKIGLQTVRFYFGGQNILTFTKLKNFDPERQNGGSTDQLTPLYKIYTFGLNLKF